jgi:hypothetical protein
MHHAVALVVCDADPNLLAAQLHWYGKNDATQVNTKIVRGK